MILGPFISLCLRNIGVDSFKNLTGYMCAQLLCAASACLLAVLTEMVMRGELPLPPPPGHRDSFLADKRES